MNGNEPDIAFINLERVCHTESTTTLGVTSTTETCSHPLDYVIAYTWEAGIVAAAFLLIYRFLYYKK